MITRLFNTVVLIAGLLFIVMLSYYVNTPIDAKTILSYLKIDPSSR